MTQRNRLKRRKRREKRSRRSLHLESLESRQLLAADPFQLMSLGMGQSMFGGEHFTSGIIAHDEAFPVIEGAVTGTSIDIEHLMGAGDHFPLGSGFGTLSPPTGISALGTDGAGFQFDSIGLGAQDTPAVIDMMDVPPIEGMPSNGITLINRGTITVGSDFDLGSLPDNLTLINEGEIVLGDAAQSATDSVDLGMLVEGSHGLPGGLLSHGDSAISVVEIGDNLPEGLDLESLSAGHGFFTIRAIDLPEGGEVPEGVELPEGAIDVTDLSEEELAALLQAEIDGHSDITVVDSGVITLPAGDFMSGHGVMSGAIELPEGSTPADLSEEELAALLQAEIDGHSDITVVDSGVITLPAGDFMPGHGVMSGAIKLPEGTSPADLSEEELTAMLQGSTDTGLSAAMDMVRLPAFTNPTNPLDTSADGLVDTADLWSILDHLNQWGARPVPHEPQDAVVYVDVNADERVTPLDALVLINWLNGPKGVLHDAGMPEDPADEESDDPTEAAFAGWDGLDEFDLLFA